MQFLFFSQSVFLGHHAKKKKFLIQKYFFSHANFFSVMQKKSFSYVAKKFLSDPKEKKMSRIRKKTFYLESIQLFVKF
jgi:hypothetical protein